MNGKSHQLSCLDYSRDTFHTVKFKRNLGIILKCRQHFGLKALETTPLILDLSTIVKIFYLF